MFCNSYWLEFYFILSKWQVEIALSSSCAYSRPFRTFTTSTISFRCSLFDVILISSMDFFLEDLFILSEPIYDAISVMAFYHSAFLPRPLQWNFFLLSTRVPPIIALYYLENYVYLAYCIAFLRQYMSSFSFSFQIFPNPCYILVHKIF